MTGHLTDKAVKALVDGATPGPWRADGSPWNRTVWQSSENRVCFMAHSNGLDDDRDMATSLLVAAAPDLARALLEARAENARLRADAQAAVAMEKAAEAVPQGWCAETTKHKEMDVDLGLAIQAAILAQRPVDGLAMVEALRKERDDALERYQGMGLLADGYQADRDRLATELAEERAHVEGLRDAVEHGPSPHDWENATQFYIRLREFNRAALAALPAKEGGDGPKSPSAACG